MTKCLPLMLQTLSAFVLETLPWALSALIGVHVVWKHVM
jgi:hypothetical protein